MKPKVVDYWMYWVWFAVIACALMSPLVYQSFRWILSIAIIVLSFLLLVSR